MKLHNPAKWQVWTDPEGTVQLVKRLLVENGRAYAPKYALAFVFMAFVAGSTAASAWIMKDVINEVFVNKDPAMVYVIAAAVLVIFSVKGAASYGQMIVLSRIGNSIVARLQKRLFQRLTQQDMSYFDRTALGDLAVRINQGAGDARGVIDMIVVTLGRDLLTLIGLVFVMVAQDPLLSVIALVIMPPAVIGVSLLVRRVRKHAKSQFVSSTRIMSVLQETALGIRIVKAFGVEPEMRRRMDSAVGDVEKQANKIAALSARTSPLMETLGGFAVGMVILYGGYSVVELGKDPGAFFSFITALLLAYDPARRLARLQVNLSKSLVGVRLMYELLDDHPALVDADGAAELAVPKGKVVIEEVRFSYGEPSVLSGLSMVAEAGKTTALVGASGAGKSTVFALLERFYDVDRGSITIDGQNIRDVTVESLRRNIAVVTQDTFLFDVSIRDNIALGRPEATFDEIRQAAIDANADDFIMEMPGGYDAPAGEGGGRLSGGQRQRIAIARAMLRNAPILLLDEATSALDAESEAKVQSALKRLMEGRTTLVIAHRLSTVRDADMIQVFDRGRVIENGTHQSLFQQDGVYRRLCELQFQESRKPDTEQSAAE
ncbi:ABC transporter ATP-binding protein [Roseibium hamelinense]|uniref:ABC transporter ATP-binding protein n=1 Tax=Roseibium hamelinense TaxID=150831 RepID=UPI003137B866